MDISTSVDYQRIAEAITYLKVNFKEQPNLDSVAAQLQLSPFHFQRLFSKWAGVSPKQFVRFLSLEYAKSILREKQATLFDTAFDVGFSSTSRLHDLFVSIQSMTPAEFKNGGKALTIQYSIHPTPFGNIFIATTEKGVCKIVFEEHPNQSLSDLAKEFPQANIVAMTNNLHCHIAAIFCNPMGEHSTFTLHLKGTPFQIKVWEALLKIPIGQLTSYGSIAQNINLPKASRAVGSAIGDNPIAFIIPCHRVIQGSGNFGQYMWGSTRKAAIIGWEAALVSDKTQLQY